MSENTATATPGPWTFTMRQQKQECCGKVMSSIGYVKADSDHVEIAVLYKSDERQEANARLIAAAPDLLDALKHILEYDDGPIHSGSRDGYEWHGRAPRVWEAARAAISKAEGSR